MDTKQNFPQPNIPSGIPPQPSHNIWLWVSVILLTIIILGGVFWYFNVGNYISPTSTPTPTPSETASPTSDEFESWQTYRNEEYGFEFRYPEGWKEININGFTFLLREPFLKEDHTKENVLTLDSMGWARVEDNLEQKLGILVFDNRIDNSTIISVPHDSAYLRQVKKRVTNGVDVWVSGPSGLFSSNCSFTSSFLNLDQGKSASLIFENCLLNAGFGQKPDPSEVFDQILSTFKFIPSTPLGTSEPEICIQVITSARNPQTGEIRDFPTPCDVPEGWIKN